jgi:hypothetical protein
VIHQASIAGLAGALASLWYESWENPFVFCYLIGLDLIVLLRAARLAPVPAEQRKPFAWSIRCANFFTPSTMSKV